MTRIKIRAASVRDIDFDLASNKHSGTLGVCRIIEHRGKHRTEIKLNRKHMRRLLAALNALGFVTWVDGEVVLRED